MSQESYIFERANATITMRRNLTESLAILEITPDETPIVEFEPGQFATLALPRDFPPINDPKQYPPEDPKWKRLLRRAYSIASGSNQRDKIELYLTHIPSGKLTEKLWTLHEGQRLWLDPRICGEFTLEPVVRHDRDLVMVATGTGLAPYISMLRTYQNTNRWKTFTVIHGVRHDSDLGYHHELTTLADTDPTVKYLPICSREEEGSAWMGPRGRVQHYLEPENFKQATGIDLSPENCHIYLCGNPLMVDETEQSLLKLGFTTHGRKQDGNIHFERYW